MARPPRLSEQRLAMAGRNNGILAVGEEKDLSYLSKTSSKPIIPTPHHSNIPIGVKPLDSVLSVCVVLQGIPKPSSHCQGNPSTLTFMNSEAYE